MKNYQPIAKFLGLTDEEYWDEYVARYMRWCINYSNEFGIPLQMLMANTAISKWYNERHEELDYQAYETLFPTYGKITTHRAKHIYQAVMADLFANYPKVLFEAAKKLTIINNPHDHTAN